MECYTTHLGLWVRVKIVDIYSSLYPLPPRFSPNLANKAYPFALHACRHEAKPRACNKSKALIDGRKQLFCAFLLYVKYSLFPQSTLILKMRCLFEENPLMKNCGITLERGRNQTRGRQIVLFAQKQVNNFSIQNFRIVYLKLAPHPNNCFYFFNFQFCFINQDFLVLDYHH